MSWDWLSFGLFTGAFLMLSGYKTYIRFKTSLLPPKPSTNATQVANPSDQVAVKKNNFALKKFLKQVINYCVSYNSSILIVGSLSESYFYSLTMVTNILAIGLGYVYAVVLVHPFTYSLEKESKY
jgi:hypothetical protein